MVFLPAISLVLSLTSAAPANPEMTADDFRIYCGWKEEVAKPENAGPVNDKLLAKVAKLAKVAPKDLKLIVAKGDEKGGSCEAVAKLYESKAKDALKGTPVGARLGDFDLVIDDPTHVVAYVNWKADQRKRVEEEACLIAWAVGSAAPVVRTLSIRAVDPRDNETSVFEGKISSEQMGKIDKARIDSFADARYIKLFDGVVFGAP